MSAAERMLATLGVSSGHRDKVVDHDVWNGTNASETQRMMFLIDMMSYGWMPPGRADQGNR